MGTLSSEQQNRRRGLIWLVVAAAVTIVLWRVPGGNYILYPFTILATWFHEIAHGLTALLLGGSFKKLVISPDGSGVAYYTGPLLFGRIGQALVAASGPLGPPLAGSALILSSRNTRHASLGLYLLGAFMVISTVIWVRSLFGFIIIPTIGLLLLAVAAKGSAGMKEFAVQFLGVQACISTYLQINYLFTYSAGPVGISDTGQIQQLLILPYWFWGALIMVVSLLLLLKSLQMAYRSP